MIGEVQRVGREAYIDEVVLLGLGVVERELSSALIEREQLGGRVARVLAIGGLLVLVAERGRHPHPGLLVDHGVVIVEIGFPDFLLAPVGRWAERLHPGGMGWAEILMHIRVADR